MYLSADIIFNGIVVSKSCVILLHFCCLYYFFSDIINVFIFFYCSEWPSGGCYFLLIVSA